MRGLGLPSYEDYSDYLRTYPNEAESLADRMRVTVTRFFRDRRCWDALEKIVLPEMAGMARGELRALSVGCSGGEEPYSLAMLWREVFGPCFTDLKLAVLAVDIDEASLERARAGLYEAGGLKEVDPSLREKWFKKDNGAMRLEQSIRDMVRFELLDATSDSFAGGFDLVLCRYLFFTYYIGARLRRAAERLHAMLKSGGTLMIGLKEDVPPELWDLFTPRGAGAGPCFWLRKD